MNAWIPVLKKIAVVVGPIIVAEILKEILGKPTVPKPRLR